MEPVKVAFVDTETTGLDPRIHNLWEIAIIQATHDNDNKTLEIESENVWRFRVNLEFADPMALKVTNYFKRQEGMVYDNPLESAEKIARCFDGRHFVANVPDFDANMIKEFLRTFYQTNTWHYHLICCENLIAGKFRCPPPWKSDDLSKYWAGIDPPGPDEKHTALGDAQWAKRLYAKAYDLEIKELI